MLTLPTQFPDPDGVHWFGSSGRIVGGKPDSRYGWWTPPDGSAHCIVKALEADLTTHGDALLAHERAVLTELAGKNLPVPELVKVKQANWLVTRVAGLSMAHLGSLPQAVDQFPFAERLATWVHFLRRAQAFEQVVTVPIDLWQANLVLPTTKQHQGGQLRLNEGISIDHAHTLVAGLDMRRPLWIDPNMARIAPELRPALLADQQALRQHFAHYGAPQPGGEALSDDLARLARKIWAEYDQPSQTQALLDSGALRPCKTIQYAVAVELGHLLRHSPPDQVLRFEAIVQRMQHPQPQHRYDSLTQAADELAQVLGNLPVVGQARLPAWDGAELERMWPRLNARKTLVAPPPAMPPEPSPPPATNAPSPITAQAFIPPAPPVPAATTTATAAPSPSAPAPLPTPNAPPTDWLLWLAGSVSVGVGIALASRSF